MLVFKEKFDSFETKIVNIRPRLIHQQEKIEKSTKHTYIWKIGIWQGKFQISGERMDYWTPGARVTDYWLAKKERKKVGGGADVEKREKEKRKERGKRIL